MNFLKKLQVVQDKSKPMRVAMTWLRVDENRTRLCAAAAQFARNEINISRVEKADFSSTYFVHVR